MSIYILFPPAERLSRSDALEFRAVGPCGRVSGAETPCREFDPGRLALLLHSCDFPLFFAVASFFLCEGVLVNIARLGRDSGRNRDAFYCARTKCEAINIGPL